MCNLILRDNLGIQRDTVCIDMSTIVTLPPLPNKQTFEGSDISLLCTYMVPVHIADATV